MTEAPARAWIDGGARGNPGPAGFGVILEHAGGRDEIGGFLGNTTNNVAEYAALATLLGRALELGLTRLEVASDSELVVKQMAGAYKVRAAHLQPIFQGVQAMKRRIPHFRLRHVRREANRDADRLANRAIDERLPLPGCLDRALLPIP